MKQLSVILILKGIGCDSSRHLKETGFLATSNKVPSKLLLRKIRKNGFMVVQYLDIRYPSKLETKIRKNQKIEFNGYLIPSIMKDEYKKEFVGIKIKNISGVKLL
nr:MAG: hypothetical protein [Caudoviricetes sp.]